MAERGVDLVVVGGGIIGASCAFYAARAGLSVTVLDRGTVGGGTTSRGEGNILISDKGPGAELEMAQSSRALWLELADAHGADRYELDRKGGLVVAASETGLRSLQQFAESQRAAGVKTVPLSPDGLLEHEPHLATDLPGGVLYPEDMQVQPVLAAATLLAEARRHGARVVTRSEVVGADRDSAGRLIAVRTTDGVHPTRAVVNAAGTWGGSVGERLGGPIPVLPRRGFILVTEPLPRVVRHKVYSAEYVENVASDDAGLETSAVIEGTRGGTVLIGASRERVGFDETLSVPVLTRLAAQAVRLFPVLRDVRVIRSYRGFRPYCPDHLPVVGPDPRVPGLLHACGHEGAGIGLAPATGMLVTELITDATPHLDPAPFDPARFLEATP